MKMNAVVHLAHTVLPAEWFIKLRRKVPLCDFNYHSASRTTSTPSMGRSGELMAHCKHCGELVEMDRTRQWRRIPVGLFTFDESTPFERLYDHPEPAAAPAPASSTPEYKTVARPNERLVELVQVLNAQPQGQKTGVNRKSGKRRLTGTVRFAITVS